MELNKLLARWRSDPEVGSNFTIWNKTPAKKAILEPIPNNLHENLRKALLAVGISKLYSHQLEAWNALTNGEHIAVASGTASGKSLCYHLPVLDDQLKNPESRSLYLFPTKALAQDQLSAVQEILSQIQISKLGTIAPAVYDGDTPSGARPKTRINSRLIFSNPDMLHTAILPHHSSWAHFFRNLKFVVIDEMHTYRGVFGSHIANVIRRLKRIATHYGSTPIFALTSATIENPLDHAERLIEEHVHLISKDGSGNAERYFLIYNPPVVNNEIGLRRSAMQEAIRLVGDLIDHQIQTIVFARSRRTVEIALKYLRLSSLHNPRINTQEIRGYRSGYLPTERRKIELGLRRGEVRTVVATNALELGIDIGAMGASILIGYPGTVAATTQQTGRAGRSDHPSAGILVATSDPIDQFLAHHPEFILEKSPESALINPDNLLILIDHILCAVFELPFDNYSKFGSLSANKLKEFLEYLQQSAKVHRSGQRYYWMSEDYPASHISLRSTSTDSILLQVDDGNGITTVGQIDRPSAMWMTHPGAIYLHEARTFLVENLDLIANTASMKSHDGDYYTMPRTETSVDLIQEHRSAPATGGRIGYGEFQIHTQVLGFRKLHWDTRELLGYEPLELPATELVTEGYWLSISQATIENLSELGLWRQVRPDYGSSWKRQRNLARQRDDFKCQVCGKPENDRQHDVHHKIPLRAFRNEDGVIDTQRANRLENLITLCTNCHHHAESAVRIRSGIAGLAFVLANLAPLFLMCDTRDLGVHADPNSPVDGGLPTLIIYERIPAGIGFSQRLFEIHTELLSHAHQLINDCSCIDGCPSCVGPGGEQGEGGKQETLALLSELVG